MIRIIAIILFSINEKQTIDLPMRMALEASKQFERKLRLRCQTKKKSVHFISRMLSHTQKGWLQFPVFSSASKPHTDYLIFYKVCSNENCSKKVCNGNSHGCKVNKTTRWSRVLILLSSDYLTWS